MAKRPVPLPGQMIQKGNGFSARWLNHLLDLLKRCQVRVGQGSGLELYSMGDGSQALRAITFTNGFWIKITGGGAAGKYDWTRVLPDAPGTWTVSSAESGTAAGEDPACEANGNTAVDDNTYVRAWRDGSTGVLLFQADDCP